MANPGNSNNLDIRDFDLSLEVIQHPVKVRMCGFGDKDRRPIDPPPAVRLIINNDRNFNVEQFIGQTHMLVVACQLYKVKDGYLNPEPENTPQGLVSSTNGSEGLSNLVGSFVTSNVFMNEVTTEEETNDGRVITPSEIILPKSIVFPFNDLSVRTEGYYRLKFHLFDLSDLITTDNSFMKHQGCSTDLPPSEFQVPESRARASVFSNVFQSYAPKVFPGMDVSTAISRNLALAGVRISVRSGSDNSSNQEQSNVSDA